MLMNCYLFGGGCFWLFPPLFLSPPLGEKFAFIYLSRTIQCILCHCQICGSGTKTCFLPPQRGKEKNWHKMDKERSSCKVYFAGKECMWGGGDRSEVGTAAFLGEL